MKVTVKPTHAIITHGNMNGSVGISKVALADLGQFLDDNIPNLDSAQHATFHGWFLHDGLIHPSRAVGDVFEVEDNTGDTVASVVLV